MRYMKRWFGWLAVGVLALALVAACNDNGNGLFDDDDDVTTPPAETPAPTPTPVDPDDDATDDAPAEPANGEPTSLRGDLEAVNGMDEVSGEISLSQLNDQIDVSITIDEGLAEGSYTHSIHEASCLDLGTGATDDDNGALNGAAHEFDDPIDVTGTEATTYTDSFDGTLADFAEGHVYVIFAENNGDQGDAVACAELQEDAGAAPGAPGPDDDAQDDGPANGLDDDNDAPGGAS